MRKIPTLFVRDFERDPRYVTRAVSPGCEWVIKGEGVATRKYDGTCVQMTPDGVWWARREVKPGKAAPASFVAIETDSETGKTVGWEPIEQSAFARWHAEALEGRLTGRWAMGTYETGTYELLGPKVNGNPEGMEEHYLMPHAFAEKLADAPRDFDGLAAWLHDRPLLEGIVWHHEDGRMAKIKKRDFPALRSAGEPGHRQDDSDQDDAKQTVQHETNPT